MAKVICLFNHKGGVSKTTTAFNLGWMMALLGKRVLLTDFDPQCNLTGMVMGYKGVDDLATFYSETPANNVKDGLAPAFESQPRQITPASCTSVQGNSNLFLLPGHIGIAEYETTLGIAQELSGSLLALRNLPGSIRFLLDATAASINADYVVVDMSPSLGPLNQNIFSTSDFFLVPLHPDYFSAMALSSLSKALPRWRAWAETAYSVEALSKADYPFPKPGIQFIGAIIQKYRPRNGRASSAFQRWIDQLIEGLRQSLIPALVASNMLDVAKYEALTNSEPWLPILEMADFNGLIAHSQEHQVPVYGLTPQLVNQRGAIWQQTKTDMDRFESLFRACAQKVFELTQ